MSVATMAEPKASTFWQRYGNAAQIGSAVVGGIALAGVVWQVAINLAQSRENAARDIYRAYLQLAVQYPRLAYPEGYATVAGLPREERARYGWFVSYLLYTCEQIIQTFPYDAQWRQTCREQIGYHDGYLCSPDAREEIGQYEPELQVLIDQVAKSSKAPECKKT